MSQDYNATINLPKTDFPMRAGLPKREPEMLQRWKKLDVYGELLKKNADKPRFSQSGACPRVARRTALSPSGSAPSPPSLAPYNGVCRTPS